MNKPFLLRSELARLLDPNRPPAVAFRVVTRKSKGATRTRRAGWEPREASLRLALLGLTLWLGPLSLPADSLWVEGSSSPMYVDKRGLNVGDILTIVVQENNSATKGNNTTTSKQSGMDASIAAFLYGPAASGLLTKGGQLPAMKYSSKNNFAGGGTINNSQNIIAQVAVRVVDVLPNQNLVVEGTRETAFSGEQQTIILRGVVRPYDVAANNTVFSYNVADATIKFLAKGAITDSQKKGWFNKIWDKISPF